MGQRCCAKIYVNRREDRKGKDMQLDKLTADQKKLWSRVDALWQMSLSPDTAPVDAALHSDYSGWVTGQDQPHGREAAIASVGPSSPRTLNYELQPLGINIFDGIVGVVHYTYTAEIESGTGSSKSVAGRWSEVYLKKNGEWIMISVSGGPDGER